MFSLYMYMYLHGQYHYVKHSAKCRIILKGKIHEMHRADITILHICVRIVGNLDFFYYRNFPQQGLKNCSFTQVPILKVPQTLLNYQTDIIGYQI